MPLHALFAKRIRVVDLENRILLHDSEQHQQADGTVNVDRHAEGHECNESCRQTERQRRHDRQRVNKAVELGCEHHVDKCDSQRDCQPEVVGCLGQLFRATAEYERVSGLHVEFGDFLSDFCDRISQYQPIEAGSHLNIALAVVSLDIVRTAVQLQLGHVTQLHHPLRCRWNEEASQPCGIVAE